MNYYENKTIIAIKAIGLALILYILLFAFHSVSYVREKKEMFNYAFSYLDKQKQRLVYTSLFVNTVFHIDEYKLKALYSETEKYGIDTYVYTHDDKDSTLLKNEELIIAAVTYSFGNMLSNLLEHKNGITYVRSYENDGKLISFSDLGDLKLDVPVYDKENCQETSLCSLYATEASLSDRILVSKIYDDIITGSSTITLSSPIIVDNDIIGDISIDVYFDLSTLASEAEIKSMDRGGMHYILVYYPGYPIDELSFRSSYVIDNNTTLIFELPVVKLFYDTFPAFIIILVVSLLLTYHVSSYFQQKIKLSQVYEDVNRDEMTGLYNRKFFTTQEFLSTTVDKSVAVLAIDGNKLKHLNDSFGHHCGDSAIKHIAKAMEKVFRDTDYLMRSGGDEFLAILPGCPPARAMELKDKLKQEVICKNIRPYNQKVSVSIGIGFKSPEEDLEYALIAADENLYLDKAESAKR